MKLLIVAGFLILTSFKSMPGGDSPARTSYLVGTNIYKKATKEKLANLLITCLKDKRILAQASQILKENRPGKSICFGIWSDQETWCLSGNNKKSSLCSISEFKNKRKIGIPFFTVYGFLYDCDNGFVYGVWVMSY